MAARLTKNTVAEALSPHSLNDHSVATRILLAMRGGASSVAQGAPLSGRSAVGVPTHPGPSGLFKEHLIHEQSAAEVRMSGRKSGPAAGAPTIEN